MDLTHITQNDVVVLPLPLRSLWDPARSTDSFRSALKTHLFAALRDD